MLAVIEYVKILQMMPHPEGGWYKEVYRSPGQISGEGDFPAGRNYATSIYFLIEAQNFSSFHRIQSDETWHFYSGDPLEVIEINENGILKSTIVGNDVLNGQVFQYTVPAGVWFASRVYKSGSFSLVGCTVSPGFDFRDFELASRQSLKQQFTDHAEIITELTRF
ncbi:MAG TPA: cupin domain-containing protein [Bacteroidia bacterium]|nr:cupin domain-containing protein [Bacteroidia bacterium]